MNLIWNVAGLKQCDLQEHSPIMTKQCWFVYLNIELGLSKSPIVALNPVLLDQQDSMQQWVGEFDGHPVTDRIWQLGRGCSAQAYNNKAFTIFLICITFMCIKKSNTVLQLLDVTIQKIAGSGTPGVLLFRNCMHWPDWVFWKLCSTSSWQYALA